MFVKLFDIWICAILVFNVKELSAGDLCTIEYEGDTHKKYCDIGGCCISDSGSYSGNVDDLCCVQTLTVILIACFVGGPFLIIVFISACCCIKRYFQDKNRRAERNNRREERRRRRDAEEEEARNNYFFPKPEDRLRLMPPQYTAEQQAPPPQYTEASADALPGAVENSESNTLQVPNANVLPLTPPPAYESIGGAPPPGNAPIQNSAAAGLTNSGVALAAVAIGALPGGGNRRSTENIPTPQISDRILETRQYMERFDNVANESRNETGYSETPVTELRAETPPTADEPRPTTISTPPGRTAIPQFRRIAAIPITFRALQRRVKTPPKPSRVTPLTISETPDSNGTDSGLSEYSEMPSPESRPVTITQIEVPKFSKTLQVVTSVAPEEQEALAYI